jgi:hypothetical protein
LNSIARKTNNQTTIPLVSETGRYSNEIYTIIEKQGLGYILDGVEQKVFAFELKSVDASDERIAITTRNSPKTLMNSVRIIRD